MFVLIFSSVMNLCAEDSDLAKLFQDYGVNGTIVISSLDGKTDYVYNIALLKKLMIVEKNPQFTIRAKTGWAMRTSPRQGWYVGYVEARGQVWFFATNIEIRRKGDEAFRREITIAALKVKGIL
jgi:hypothetical protein